MVYINQSGAVRMRHGLVALLAVAALGLASAPAQAAGFYLGAGVGQSNADVDLAAPDFDQKDIGWKVFAGARALSFGAELQYMDFGKANGTGAALSYKGFAGYGLYFLPLPAPILDVYVKGGLARVNSDLHLNSGSLSTNDTKLTFGAGLQLNLPLLAIRGEYEKFKVDGAKPSLLSISAIKSF